MSGRDILGELLLPIEDLGLDAVCAEALDLLEKDYCISEEEAHQFIINEKEKWAENPESVPDAIHDLFDLVYRKFHTDLYAVFPYAMEGLVRRLFKVRAMAFEELFVFLSYIPLLFYFAKRHKMSAAKVASLMSALDARLQKFSWRQYQACFAGLGISQTLTESDVVAICEQDKAQEFSLLGDADIGVACEIVGSKAASLGAKSGRSLAVWLSSLVNGEAIFFPYIQILHYQCVISEWYDHHLTTLYEFSPRGNACSRLLKEYDGYASAGNPFLNNAKAVDTIDRRWVLSRDQNIEQAAALVEILESINDMNYTSARELCGLVRAWVYRVLSIKRPVHAHLLPFSVEQIDRLSARVCAGETQSKGIIEQRLFDFWCSALHPESEGWREKGVGDSVNANNLSRKKFGDLDFQDSLRKKIISYEIHAGRLNRAYFEGHRRTLVRIISLRAEELSSVAELSEWSLEVRYVSHSVDFAAPEDEIIGGINVSYSFRLMNAVVKQCPEPSEEQFNRLFVDVLNKSNSPQIVRQKVADLLSA